ncbi:MAG: hypothetical protein QF893_00425 [Alphaproteobacteria bacterium]|jgi:hypothetical protein|nr:hypothetical protein [Alphaproteobacteria bacterium]
MTQAELFARKDGFMVTAGGKGGPSPLAGVDAGYWDWGFVRYVDDGILRSFISAASQAGKITLLVEGRLIEIQQNKLRLYLAPSFRQSLASTEPPPPMVARWLDRNRLRDRESYAVEEYLLARGREYHGEIRLDRYHLPPRRGGRPRAASNPILHLSDRPFDTLPADAEPIPSFRGFVY